MSVPLSVEWRLLFDPISTSAVERTGKFVQLRVENRTIVVLGLIEQSPYHANLVEQFLEREGVHGGSWATLPDLYAPPKGVRVIGGGWFRLSPTTCTLSGSSRAYGHFDRSWFESQCPPSPFSNLLLVIED